MRKRTYKLKELAQFLKAEVKGDQDCLIDGIAPLERAVEGQISFLEREGYRKYLAHTKAQAMILRAEDTEHFFGNVLIVSDPYLAYAKLTSLFFHDDLSSQVNIDKSVILGKDCQIDESAIIGPNCILKDRVKISKGVIVGAGSTIGSDSEINANSRLYPRVTLYHKVKIGERVIVHSGAVIGADGFGLARDKESWCKIYQLGGVCIGNDVEIGANTTIDRGALTDTVIEDGVKLDNLIQVAHNVQIKANTVIAGCTGIAGSAVIGRNCLIGGGVCINGHITICDGAVITGMTGITKSIKTPGVYTSVMPAFPHRIWWRMIAKFIKLTGVKSNE